MRRSGSTLQYQIATDLVTRRGVGTGLGYVQPMEFENLARNHGANSQFKVVKTHAYIPGAERLLESGQAKALYSHRDIRDVVVSLMKMQKTDFRQLRDEGMVYALLKEYEDWNRTGEILVSRYEDITAYLPREIGRIAAYLGVSLAEGEADELATEYALDRQKERINRFQTSQLAETLDGFKIDAKTLLHDNHINSGSQGQWRDALSRLEAALVEHMARDWMREHGYSFSQPWLARRMTGACFLVRQRVRALLGRCCPAWGS
jgi:hypothetical protein